MKRDTVGLNLHLNGTRLNPERKEDPKVLDTLLQDLKSKNIDAWSVLSAFTQTIGADLTGSLQPLFDNEALGYIIQPDSSTMNTDPNCGLYLVTKPDCASLKLALLFKVIAAEKDGKAIATIRTTIVIPDHRVAGAIVTTTVDPISIH